MPSARAEIIVQAGRKWVITKERAKKSNTADTRIKLSISHERLPAETATGNQRKRTVASSSVSRESRKSDPQLGARSRQIVGCGAGEKRSSISVSGWTKMDSSEAR